MQNTMMWILHIAAVMFGLVGLIITIPLHMVLANQRKKIKSEA